MPETRLPKLQRSDQIFFFFSSRRRHTRYIGDWSSDVCSSDLAWAGTSGSSRGIRNRSPPCATTWRARSEERRVGKECRSRGALYQHRKKGEERRRPAPQCSDL